MEDTKKNQILIWDESGNSDFQSISAKEFREYIKARKIIAKQI